MFTVILYCLLLQSNTNVVLRDCLIGLVGSLAAKVLTWYITIRFVWKFILMQTSQASRFGPFYAVKFCCGVCSCVLHFELVHT